MGALAIGTESVVRIPAGQQPRFLLEECRDGASHFVELLDRSAVAHGVEPRALGVRTLLHLPRVAGSRGELKRWQVQAELTTCAVGLRADQAEVPDLMPASVYLLQDLRFVSFDARKAARIFGHLHYLRSVRAGSRYFALVDPVHGRPVTLCGVSPLEWSLVGRRLRNQFAVPPERVWDVSRLYSFDLAPGNAISFLLARVRRALRRTEPQIKLLATAVDPNLGFTGSSYRGANWQPWMSVRPRPYLYLDGRYISPRGLREVYGTANLAKIQADFGAAVELSRSTLLDSTVYFCSLQGETEPVPLGERPRLRR